MLYYVQRRAIKVRHAYKYLAKTIHRIFFPIFALLDVTDPSVGQRVVAQRKLLYIEKLFACIMLGAPRLRTQLADRVKTIELEVTILLADSKADATLLARRQGLLKILQALQLLMSFFLPAVFRVGYLVRCCTWDGRGANSSASVQSLLEEVLLLLVHVLNDLDGKNEYVRTVAVTLATWQAWNSRLPAAAYMEESCEALLSRMSHRCSSHRHLSGFESTFDLFLTLPPPSKASKATRGMLREGLVSVFSARIRAIVMSDGSLPFAKSVSTKQMHSEFELAFPRDFNFPKMPSVRGDPAVFERVIRRALQCLTNKSKLSEEVASWFEKHVVPRDTEDTLKYKRALEAMKEWFAADKKNKKRPAPLQAPRKLLPKPRAKALIRVLINRRICVAKRKKL
jgi:hypothetical protein